MSALSLGGMFMATGGTDHMVRVYYLGGETPIKASEIDGHTVSLLHGPSIPHLTLPIFLM